MRILLFCLSFIFFWNCSEPTAHGITDIGNSVAGNIFAEDGSPMPKARVVIYFDHWENEKITDSLETKSDANGFFEIKNVKTTDSYILFVKKDSLSALSFVSDTIVLRSPKLISSRIDGKSSGWVRVMGQDNKQDIAEDGSFVLTQVPAGQVALIYGQDTEGESRFLFETLDDRDTINLPDLMEAKAVENWLQLVDYRYYKEDGFGGILAVDFNDKEEVIEPASLTVSLKGYAPEEVLKNIVLPVRLDSLNFDFNKFVDPSMLMVFSADGKTLAFEVDYWNPETEQALLWVRLDSIPAGATSIDLIYRGASWARESPFQKGDGVSAVLHMNGDETIELQGKSILSDSGFIGKGVALSPSQYIDLDTLDPCSGDFTISLWAYWYGKNGHHQILFSQRSFWSDSTSRFQWHFDYFNDVFAVYNNIDQRNKFTFVDLPVNEWAYLTLLFKDGLLSMFVNGVRIGEPAAFVPTELNAKVPLRVGGNEVDVETWNGVLDEVRVEKVARSEEWIRISYEVQKAVKNK